MSIETENKVKQLEMVILELVERIRALEFEVSKMNCPTSAVAAATEDKRMLVPR